MKGILKRTAGTGATYWTVTYPHGNDHKYANGSISSDDGLIFVLDRTNLDRSASSIIVCREDEEKLTNEDYDTIVEFEIVERLFLYTTTTFREAKIKWNNK
jgi:hypothetical protein